MTKQELVAKVATDTGMPSEHHARILLNGTVVAEPQWQGMVRREIDVACPAGLLTEGSNTLEVAGLLNAGVPYSFFYVDSFDVAYRRAYRAVNDRLFCSAELGMHGLRRPNQAGRSVRRNEHRVFRRHGARRAAGGVCAPVQPGGRFVLRLDLALCSGQEVR